MTVPQIFGDPKDMIISGMKVSDMDREELLAVVHDMYIQHLKWADEVAAMMEELDRCIADVKKNGA